jgi:hypothetical protein
VTRWRRDYFWSVPLTTTVHITGCPAELVSAAPIVAATVPERPSVLEIVKSVAVQVIDVAAAPGVQLWPGLAEAVPV